MQDISQKVVSMDLQVEAAPRFKQVDPSPIYISRVHQQTCWPSTEGTAQKIHMPLSLDKHLPLPPPSPCQVHHLTDALVFSAFLQRLKETAFPSGKKAAAGNKDAASQQQEDEDEPAAGGSSSSSSGGSDDTMLTLAREAMQNLGVALQQISLKGNDDVRQMCIEGCAEFLVATKAIKVPTTLKRMGLQAGKCRRQAA